MLYGQKRAFPEFRDVYAELLERCRSFLQEDLNIQLESAGWERQLEVFEHGWV